MIGREMGQRNNENDRMVGFHSKTLPQIDIDTYLHKQH